MKTKLIIAAILGIANAGYSQCAVGNLLAASGDVGLGTGSPANKLHIATCGQNGGIVIDQIGTWSAAGAAAISLKNSSNAQGRHWMLASTGNGNIGNGGNFEIDDFGTGPYNPTTSAINRFFIEGTTGNIGIGSTSPTEQLHTTAGVRFQGLITGGTGQLSMVVADAFGKLWRSALPGSGVCGTANFVAKDNGSGTAICSQIFDNGTTVGINATSGFGYTWNGGLTGPTGVPGMGSTGNARLFVNGITGAVAYYATSDARYKKDIHSIKNASDIINQLDGKTYFWKTNEYKDNGFTDVRQYGFIAQELEKVVPEAVATNEHGYKSVNYDMIIPILVQNAKEMQKQIADQKEMINALINKTGTSTGMNDLNTVPAGFNLDQNIPNPFSNETVIKYTLPTTVSNASMVVYDLSGKQVASFPLTEKGTSSITITSEKLAAGIYIYSIMADGKIADSKRMVVSQK